MICDILVSLETALKANINAQVAAVATAKAVTLPTFTTDTDVAISDALIVPQTNGPWLYLLDAGNHKHLENLDQYPSGSSGHTDFAYRVLVTVIYRADKTRRDMLLILNYLLWSAQIVIQKQNTTGKPYYWMEFEGNVDIGSLREGDKFFLARAQSWLVRERQNIGNSAI